ncbi:class I SAM-dependent methyltransferase [Lentzea sp. NPDC059081]|uniref:class I SAM-dependent methyltransferase n=1 Tax=Lentzea sp. NPDC059081 TaxID=3346719 RepID=UPI00369690FE
MTSEVNTEQAAWWDTAGHGWARVQDIVGLILRPYQDLLVETALTGPRRRVLDVGCGTGGTTRALAEATGADCVGVDISESMLAAAREHGGAEFVRADAQVHTFDEPFDLVVSRFGVMFFDDPAAAFHNLLRTTIPGGDLCFVTWRTADDNPFMTTASQVAASLAPGAPAPDPDGPGPFSLADAGKTRRMLETAGWTEVGVEAVDRVCRMPEDLLIPYLSNMGPVARALAAAPESERAGLVESVRGAFDGFAHDGEMRIPGGVWRVTASAPL